MVQPPQLSSATCTAERPLTVAFFAGSDVTAHSIVNRLTPVLTAQGHTVHLMFTRGKVKATAPEALRQLFFVEHTLLQDHAYPFVDRHGKPDPTQPNSPEGWRAIGHERVRVHDVADVNEPEFVDSLDDLGLDLAVSVRCYQRFRQPIIDRLGGDDTGSALLNLHPGLLPRYRGVMTSLRSMQDGAPETGFTLHHIEPEFDTGPIVGRAVCPLDYSRSVLENMALNFRSAADLILGLLYELSARQPMAAVTQASNEAQYYSYATEDDLAELGEKGIDLFRTETVVNLICELFGGRLTRPDELRHALWDALAEQDIPVHR